MKYSDYQKEDNADKDENDTKDAKDKECILWTRNMIYKIIYVRPGVRSTHGTTVNPRPGREGVQGEHRNSCFQMLVIGLLVVLV